MKWCSCGSVSGHGVRVTLDQRACRYSASPVSVRTACTRSDGGANSWRCRSTELARSHGSRITVSLAWVGGSCAAKTSWKTAVCAQPDTSVLLSCEMVLLLPVFPMRMCTGVPAQHGAPPPPPARQCVCDGAGAMRRCEASRHSVGLRWQQPVAHPHVVRLPPCGVASFGDGLVSLVVLLLLRLQLGTRG